MKLFGSLTLAVAVGAIAMAAGTGASEAQYFKGKTISIIVGFPPGGGTDKIARHYADLLPKYIPGSPTVIVRNMPGGGTSKAQTYLYTAAAKDGTEIGFNSFQSLSQIIDLPGSPFKYPKVAMIGGVKSASYAAGVLTAKAKTPEDLMKATDLKYAGRAATHTIDLIATGAYDVLGVKFKYVPGYNGSSKSTQALLQEEVNLGGAGFNQYLDYWTPQLFEKGLMVPLWQFRYISPDGKSGKLAQYGDLPLFEEVYEKVKGKKPDDDPQYQAWNYLVELQSTANFSAWGHPDMNKEALAILRKAWGEASADPKSAEVSKQIMKGYVWEWVSAEQMQPTLDKMANPDPKYVKYWADHIERYQK